MILKKKLTTNISVIQTNLLQLMIFLNHNNNNDDRLKLLSNNNLGDNENR